MNRTAIALVMALVPWAAGCRRGPTELVSKECGAAITMPAPHTYEPYTSGAEGMSYSTYQYRAVRDGVTYGLVCIPDWKKLMDGREDPEEALDSFMQGVLMDGEDKLLSEHDVTVHSIRGHEFMTKRTADMRRNRVYVFPTGVIYTFVIGSDVGLPPADQFLDSLRRVTP